MVAQCRAVRPRFRNIWPHGKHYVFARDYNAPAGWKGAPAGDRFGGIPFPEGPVVRPRYRVVCLLPPHVLRVACPQGLGNGPSGRKGLHPARAGFRIILDPTTKTFANTSTRVRTVCVDGAPTLLSSGKVLVAGGALGVLLRTPRKRRVVIRSPEHAATGSMQAPSAYPLAILLGAGTFSSWTWVDTAPSSMTPQPRPGPSRGG